MIEKIPTIIVRIHLIIIIVQSNAIPLDLITQSMQCNVFQFEN